MKDDTSKLTQLGSESTEYAYDGPDKRQLEIFPNQNPNRDYKIELIFPEFTSLCLDGDTSIDVCTDETKNPEGVLICDLVGKEGKLFSFDPSTNKPIVKRFHSVRKTRENAECVEVIMLKYRGVNRKNRVRVKESIFCTPDHLFLVRAGWGKYIWVEAKNLKSPMRLVASQRSGDTLRSISRHRLIMESITRKPLNSEQAVHHIDGNHYNNYPANLQLKSIGEHLRDHKLEKYGYEDSLNMIETLEKYRSGESCLSIAKEIGCDWGTIRDRLETITEIRGQSEQLSLQHRSQNEEKWRECRELYEKGYNTYRLSEFFQVHNVTIGEWVRKAGGELRESNYARYNKEELPALNHQIIDVIPADNRDVYNMEVEDTKCFFANEVVVHNCPKTGQPDFATINIHYIPDKFCLESKSIKLYFFRYRNYGGFMETLTNKILDDFVGACSPRWMKVEGKFNARGGLVINVSSETTE